MQNVKSCIVHIELCIWAFLPALKNIYNAALDMDVYYLLKMPCALKIEWGLVSMLHE